MEGWQRGQLRDQYLTDQGVTDEQIQASYDAQNVYLSEHPEYAQYREYLDLVNDNGGAQAFTEQMMAMNPGFAQHVRNEMTDLDTGVIDYDRVYNPDSYLASQGIRSSVYSPVVGNEPSTAPGGAPMIPGVEPGQPIIPTETRVIGDAALYADPYDAADDAKYGGGEGLIAYVGPDYPHPIQILDPTPTGPPDQPQYLVQAGEDEAGNPIIGYIDASILESAAPATPAGGNGVVQPGGGLGEVAGNVTGALGAGVGGVAGALGAGKDALGAVVGSMFGAPGQESKPAETSLGIAPGAYDVVPANDGIGEQSTAAGSDRTWMEFMLDNDAYVSTEYKGPPTANMAYQDGHGAATNNHAAYDISCVSGNCSGKPVTSPVTGKVVCAGYEQGTGEALGSPGCTYSKNTTYPGSAHTVVVQVGTTPEGLPLQLSVNHVGEANLQPGQTINVGDQLGTIGDTDGGPHVHVEGWVGDPTSGYLLVDPQLLLAGYYGPVDSVTTQMAQGTTPANYTPIGSDNTAAYGDKTLGEWKQALGVTDGASPGYTARTPAGTNVPIEERIDTSITSPYQEPRSAPPETIVYHFTETDSLDQTLSVLDERGLSANYIVDKDGTIYETVNPDSKAYTQGIVKDPRQDLPGASGTIADPNDRAIGIEIVNEGNAANPGSTELTDFARYTPEQLAAVDDLTRYLTERYGITPSRETLLAHSDLNTVDKYDPGPRFPHEGLVVSQTGTGYRG
jgi:N-acetyl-anhydromuramyl-L-alanine amidase AmpD